MWRHILAAVAALALVPAAPARAETEAQTAAYMAAENITAGDDQLFLTAPSALIFIRERSASPNEYRRLWVRTEFRQPLLLVGVPYLSTLELNEFDCAARTLRTLSAAPYSGRNLTGTTAPITPALTWRPVQDGSVGAYLLDKACE